MSSRSPDGRRRKIRPQDLERLRAALETEPAGLTRAQLAAELQVGDRHARDLITAAVERGALPIVAATPAKGSRRPRYRLARSRPEVEAERARLMSYAVSLLDRRAGLERAWRAETGEPPALFPRQVVDRVRSEVDQRLDALALRGVDKA